MTGDVISGKKLYREMRHHPDLFAGIAQEIGTRFLPSGMKTIVVVNRVLEEACVIYKHLESMGFKVGLAVNQQASRMLENSYVTNGSIERYKLPHDDPNSIQVLISPQVIGEGFDAPATECVVWASPTHSSLRYTQVMGRGARRCPGKAYCLVVDFVYMIEGYGYSMNFAQFFKHSEMKELQDGLIYVGPMGDEQQLNIPKSFTSGGRIVSIAKATQQVIPEAGEWLSRQEVLQKLDIHGDWLDRAVRSLNLATELRRSRTNRHVATHFSPEVVAALEELLQWKTLSELAYEVNSTTQILKSRIRYAEQDLPPSRKAKGIGDLTLYPPEIQDRLIWILAFKNIREMSLELGVSQNWVNYRLPHAEKVLGAKFKSLSLGKVTIFAPEVLDVLKNVKSWNKTTDVARSIKLGQTAVLERIRSKLNENPEEMDQDYLLAGNWTFVSPVFEAQLAAMPRRKVYEKPTRSAEDRPTFSKTELCEKKVSLGRFSKLSGRSLVWLRSRMERYSISTTQMQGKTGRLATYLALEDATRLLDYSKQERNGE
jgi:hypothetical protein